MIVTHLAIHLAIGVLAQKGIVSVPMKRSRINQILT